MWCGISLLPYTETYSHYNGLMSKIILAKDKNGWIDLARFYYESPQKLSEINSFTITKKVVKWADIPPSNANTVKYGFYII